MWSFIFITYDTVKQHHMTKSALFLNRIMIENVTLTFFQ